VSAPDKDLVDRIRERVPRELQALPQWLLWRYEERGGKQTKIPKHPSGRNAEAPNPDDWFDLDAVVDAYLDGRFDGLGLAFSADRAITGVDFDNCIRAVNGKRKCMEWAEALVRQFGSYAEISPSGNGLKLWCRGQKPGPRCRTKKLPWPEAVEAGCEVEMYDRERFFTVTGRRVWNLTNLADAQPHIDDLYHTLFDQYDQAPVPTASANGQGSPLGLTDHELLDRMFESQHGADIRALWQGDVGGHGGDHSAADLALVNHLAWWTGYDAGRTDRLFRASGLMRDKWDERRGQQTYGEMTVERACAGRHTADGYQPRVASGGSRSAQRQASQPPHLRDTDEAEGEAVETSSEAPADPQCLADWHDYIDRKLSTAAKRHIKQRLTGELVTWALEQDRLVWETGLRGAYLLDEDKAIAVSPTAGLHLRAGLVRAGINPTEASYNWMTHGLETAAYMRGRKIELARWSAHRVTDDESVVYISNGEGRMVRARCDGSEVECEIVPNGTDNVVFAADACLPEWDLADPVDPLDIAAFRPNIDPSEEIRFAPAWQLRLWRVWLTAMFVNVRPLPIAAFIGGKGGGKSTALRAIIKTLDPSKDGVSMPDDVRDFETAITGDLVYGIDNLDIPADDLPKWFGDRLATTVTGGQVYRRMLYSDGDQYRAKITAAVIISSRTAAYTRPDLTERTAPCLTREWDDDARRAERVVEAELLDNRNRILTWLAERGARLLLAREQAPRGLPARFLDFAELVWADCLLEGCPDDAAPTLQGLRRGQAYMVRGAHELLDAIMATLQEDAFLKGTPTEIVRELEEDGHRLPQFGGGKAIANAFRDLRQTLEALEYRYSESTQGNNTILRIEAPWSDEAGESGELDDDEDPFNTA
jgi:primase-polymerase (primpol)-like protein